MTDCKIYPFPFLFFTPSSPLYDPSITPPSPLLPYAVIGNSKSSWHSNFWYLGPSRSWSTLYYCIRCSPGRGMWRHGSGGSVIAVRWRYSSGLSINVIVERGEWSHSSRYTIWHCSVLMLFPILLLCNKIYCYHILINIPRNLINIPRNLDFFIHD